MRRLLASSLVVLFVVACGSSKNQSPDAPAATPDAGAPDAMPPPSTLTVVDGGGATVTSWDFGGDDVGATAGVTLFLRQSGTAPSEPLGLTLVGANAGDFSIVTPPACLGEPLAAGDLCAVRLAFKAGAAGARAGTLHVTGGGTPLDLPLGGMGVTPSGLASDTGTADLGPIEVGQSASASIIVSNASANPISLGARTVSGGFTTASDNCPAQLTAGGACTVTIALSPQVSGLALGALVVPSPSGALTVPLRADGLRRLSITASGAGAGTVTSAPSGISCGTGCSALFIGDVTLTAAPASGDLFGGWTAPCGADAACVTHDGPSASLTARFVSSTAKQIMVTFKTNNTKTPGYVYLVDAQTNATITRCTASCTTYVEVGTQVEIYGFTPSTWSGWSGDCTETTHDCDLGTVISNRAVNATFLPDEREVATLQPSAPVTGLAMTADGDLIVASADAVARVKLDGTQVWRTTIANAGDVATDAAGNVYGLGAGGVFALSSAGALQWTTAATVGRAQSRTIDGAISVPPDGGVIAALAPTGASVFDGTGTLVFAVNLPNSQAIATAADDSIGLAALSTTTEGVQLRRYTKTGGSLAGADPLPGEEDGSIAFDATGAVCVDTTGHGNEYVSRLDSSLAPVFTIMDATGASGAILAGVAVDSEGDVVALRGDTDTAFTGLDLKVLSPADTTSWTHQKVATEYPLPVDWDGVLPSALATDGQKHIAVAGTYGLDGSPWIQVYAMP